MADLISELLKEQLVTPEQVEDAHDKQAGSQRPLHEMLVELGFVKETDLVNVISKIFAVPVLQTDESRDSSLLKLIPFDKAGHLGIFPLRIEGKHLLLAMSNPLDIPTIEDVGIRTGYTIKPVLATKSQISALVRDNYLVDDALYDLLKNADNTSTIRLAGEGDASTVPCSTDSSPAVRLVNLIIADAVKMRASDIHIEPQEQFVIVRYRIDGLLKFIMKAPAHLTPRIATRIKILSSLDIAETRKSQDGRIKVFVNDQKMDLRVAVVPTLYGEKIAIRILNYTETSMGLDGIGFEEDDLARFKKALKKPQGFILVCGPTGSGKTSTLYAALSSVKSETKQIITIEDPIEYILEGINQIQLNAAKDVTFATSLRSTLRQDPNIIFVGEIRDSETADVAFRAALTGHLVLSTLHANNAVASIGRLFDLGLEPYIISSSLSIVIAQRLVRLICPQCRAEVTPCADLLAKYSPLIKQTKILKFYAGAGCEACNFTGFRGRTAVIEVLEITDPIRALIAARGVDQQIFQEAKKNGMHTMTESAMLKLAQGATTLEEIARVIDMDTEEVMHAVPPSKTPKLLIADDEDDIRLVLAKRLQTAGYEVIEAKDGKEALEKAFKYSPDLILMDISMPNMNGFDATKALRAQLATASIPIILLTARGDKESELQGLDIGADDYITKPYDKDKLLARIKILLRRK
ncbi:MAG: ATPase, T2SS/T4P/T4SS family [Elusimicrobiaceae bacterium]